MNAVNDGLSNPWTLGELESALDDAPLQPVQWRVLIICLLLSVLDGYDLASMALAVPLLSQEWNLQPSDFSTALSAALAGLGIGSLLSGPAGDRWGRKPMVILSGLVVGIGSLGTAFSGSLGEIISWRVFTGIGFGIAMPNIYALVSDFMPSRRRVFSAACLACAVSCGGLIAGATAPFIISLGGWSSLFTIGGALPLLVSIFAFRGLEESPKYLLTSGKRDRLSAVVTKLSLSKPLADARAEPAGPQHGSPARLLLHRDHIVPTVAFTVFWTVNAFCFYLIANWLPTIMVANGLPLAQSMQSVSYIYAGGMVGGLVMSWLMDRSGRFYAVVPLCSFLLGSVAFLGASLTGFPMAIWLPSFLVVGAVIGGGQYICAGFGSRILPVAALATGLGVIGALSRIGGVLGPIAGGEAVRRNLAVGEAMAWLVIPTLLCACASLIILFSVLRQSRKN